MSIQLSIESEQVNVKSGNNARGPWQIREQEAWAYLVNRDGTAQKYPTRVMVQLEENQPPYAAGAYTIAPSSFYPGQFGSLMFKVRLVPVRAKVAA